MRQKKIKRILGNVLSAALIVSMLAGCGRDSGNVGQNNASAANTAAQTGEDVTQQEEPFEVSVMVRNHEGTPGGEYGEQVIAKLEDYTNCKIDFTWVPEDGYNDKLGLTLAQGDDMPMIIQCDLTAPVISAAKAGAFWDLSEFITDSEALPNLSQANPNILKASMIDGQLIGIYRSRVLGRYGWGYRKDWADRLGLDEPETIDDLYEMLYKFTYEDPDGNGKDDTYGLNLCKYMGPFDLMQTWFGCGNGWVEQEGNLVPVHQTPEYREALDWFRKIYEDGLVFSDFAVRDSATWNDPMYNGECGVFVDMIEGPMKVTEYFEKNQIPAVTGEGYASMKMMIGLARDENSEMRSRALDGFGGVFVITKAAKTEEDVMKCLKFLDKLCDNEMMVLCYYGLEGINWEKDENGYMVDLDKDNGALGSAYAGLNQLNCDIPFKNGEYDPPIELTPVRQELKELQAEAEKYIVYNPALGYKINSATYATDGAALDEFLSATRTQYIVGDIDETGLENAWDTWLKQGGDKLIAEINELYHADINR